MPALTTVNENISQMRMVYLATETAYGTANTTGTYVWPGKTLGWLSETAKREIVKPKVGLYISPNTAKILTDYGALDLPSTPFDHASCAVAWYYFANGPKTGVLDGGTSTGQIFKTSIPTYGRVAGNSMTLQVGGDYEVEQMTGALFTEYEVSGDEGGYVMHTSKIVGRAPSYLNNTGTFVPARATPPTFAYVNGSQTVIGMELVRTPDVQLYLDAIGAASYGLAGARINDSMLKFKIMYKVKWEPLFLNNATQVVNANGVPGPTRFVPVDMEITGELTFVSGVVGTGASGGQIAKFRANTPQLMRLSLPGKLVTLNTGGVYTNQVTNFDSPVNYSAPQKIGEKNGIDVFSMSIACNPDIANMASINTGFVTTVLDGIRATPMVLPV